MSRIVQSKQVYNAGIHEFNTYGNGTLSSNVGGLNVIQTLSILNGNIGIGTNVPMSKLDVRGNIVCSNISVIGDFVTLNTITSNTEQMVIENAGTGPALKVTQTGNNSVAEFYDKESGVALFVGNGGNVGIGTTNPMAKLDVRGSIFINNTINTVSTTILNASFNLPPDTTQRYIFFTGLSPGYNIAVDITMASFGYGDYADERYIKFSFIASIRGDGSGAGGAISSITTFGPGATNNITIGTPIANTTYIAVPIIRTTTLYNTYYYTLTAICTCMGYKSTTVYVDT